MFGRNGRFVRGIWSAGVFCWGVCFVTLGGMGCLSPLPKVKAPVQTPEAFARKGKAPLPERWWQALADRNASRWIELGLRGNLDLRAATARLAQRVAIARRSGAQQFPTLSARGDAGAGVNRFGFVGDLLAGLAASYELDLWGRIRSAVAAARLDVLASRETRKAAAISLSAEIASTWYSLVERQGQAALLKQQMRTNRQSLDLLTARFRLGQTNAADVLQQRQLLEAQRGELVQVQAQATVFAHQLAVLLGKPPKSVNFPNTSTFGTLPPLPQTGLPAQLVRRRPDIRSAYLAVLAAHRRVGVAIADQFPRLTLSANTNISSNINGARLLNTNSAGVLNNWLANLAAGIVAPLLDGGARRAEIQRTRAVVKETLQTYGATILRAFQEVENALTRENAQHKLLASQRKQRKLAQQVVQRTRYRYLQGAESFLRVLDAVRSQQTLQRAHLTAQRDLWLFRIALCRALAGGWRLQSDGTTPPAPTSPLASKGPNRGTP